MKQIIITLIAIAVIILIGVGVYFIMERSSTDLASEEGATVDTTESEEEDVVKDESTTVIGSSAGGRTITAYHYGTGDTELLFVGGIHGGYEWNTTLVARELMSYLESSPNVIPKAIKVTVVPVLNPDGLFETVGTVGEFNLTDVPPTLEETIPGRFNANNVDLNRNFDCEWQSEGKWQERTVSGGSSAFSEPESRAIKSYIDTQKPDAVVVWYSSAGGVFASNCRGGVLPETTEITNVYAKASGYPAFQEFNFYEITGDMVNWLAKNNIPGISVLLTTHESVEWSKNKAGIEALFEYYAK